MASVLGDLPSGCGGCLFAVLYGRGLLWLLRSFGCCDLDLVLVGNSVHFDRMPVFFFFFLSSFGGG